MNTSYTEDVTEIENVSQNLENLYVSEPRLSLSIGSPVKGLSPPSTSITPFIQSSVSSFEPIEGPSETVLPTITGQSAVGSLITFEEVQNNLIMKYKDPSLDTYYDYFQNLGGNHQDDFYGQGPVWIFKKRLKPNVRDLLNRILSGNLPPPNQLAIPSERQLEVNINDTGLLPTHEVINQPVQIMQHVPIHVEQEPEKVKKTRKKKEQLVLTPSQAIRATMSEAYTQRPLVQPTIPYNPLEYEPGESQAAYERRIQFYTYLVNLTLANGQRIPAEAADLLSRMRNNVDIEGVEYNPQVMTMLNTYLPVS